MSRRSRMRSTSLDPIQLIDFTRFYAAEVHGGRYPYVEFDTESRWHQRIYRDQRVDVWLLSWLPSQGTALHDHGGSSGAFTVIAGELAETVHLRGRLGDHVHGVGTSVGFGAQYVHDVRNLSNVPAVSVHAYSRPLTSMTYYDLEGSALVPIKTVRTDDPEPDAGELRVAS